MYTHTADGGTKPRLSELIRGSGTVCECVWVQHGSHESCEVRPPCRDEGSELCKLINSVYKNMWRRVWFCWKHCDPNGRITFETDHKRFFPKKLNKTKQKTTCAAWGEKTTKPSCILVCEPIKSLQQSQRLSSSARSHCRWQQMTHHHQGQLIKRCWRSTAEKLWDVALIWEHIQNHFLTVWGEKRGTRYLKIV